MLANYTLPTLKCIRCGHEWIPRIERIPKYCPKCKSPYWNRERGAPWNYSGKYQIHYDSIPTRKSEISGLNWIIKTTGFSKVEVRFSNRGTPDFIIPDGRTYEVKKVAVSKSIVIPVSQIDKLKEHNTQILVFDVTGEGEPITIIPASALNRADYETQKYGYYGPFRVTFNTD